MNLRTRVTVVFATAAVAATAAFPALSGASPIDDKRRQAAELQRQIDANDNQIVTLSERLNGATLPPAAGRGRHRRGAASHRRRHRPAQEDPRHPRPSGPPRSTRAPAPAPRSARWTSRTSTTSSARSKYASAAADHDNVLIAKLQKAQEELDARKADLERQRAAAKAEGDAAAAAKSKIESANQQKQALKSQVSGEIANLLAQEQQARAAAQQRVAAAGPPRTNTGSSGSSGSRAPIPQNFPNAPAPNGGAAAAVAFAKAQVGKGYRYATSGPDTFDCSGLTAAAWQQGGVSLAHYSGAQYQETIRIGAGDLQPGDLVFYGPGGSQHVEIYIGGGMVVSASNPSSGVKLAGVRYGSASGYGRVRT